MCFICDGGTPAEFHDLIDRHIRESGWHLMAVDPGGGRGLWVYTIGLLERYAHPELVVTDACCHPCAASALNDLGAQVRDGVTFRVGDQATSRETTAQARFGAVHPRQWQTDRFNQWREYYRGRPDSPEPMALQVITQGRSGRWQDDPTNRRWRHHRLDRAPHLAGRPGQFRR
jgi:hypothetical protein